MTRKAALLVAVALLAGTILAAQAVTTLWYERRFLPRIAGED